MAWWFWTLGAPETVRRMCMGSIPVGSILDCVRKSQVDGIAKQPRYLWGAPFMGPTQQGHVPIVHQIALFWAPTRPLKQGHISKQQCLQAQAAYQSGTSQWETYVTHSAEVMTRALYQVWTSDQPQDTSLDSFHAAVNECFHTHFPPMSAPNGNNPQHLSWPNWQHRAKLQSIRSCTGAGVFRAWHHLARYAAIRRHHRRFAAQIRRSHFCDIVQQVQVAASRHDMHRMFSLINRYSPKTIRRRIQITNQAGAIASPQEELTILKDFVADIWGGPSHIPVAFTQAPGVPFSVSELAAALRGIPLHRAVALPFAPGIAWRPQSHIIAPILHHILCQWWSVTPPYIPQCWKDGWMLMLGKPQKPATSPYNLRPIALQDPVGKALVGLLIQTANADAQPLLMPWPIWAYLPKRSTLDAVCRVAYHCGQVKKLVASQKPPPHARAAAIPMYRFAAEWPSCLAWNEPSMECHVLNYLASYTTWISDLRSFSCWHTGI